MLRPPISFPQVALIGSIGSQTQGWGTTPVVSKHIWSFGPGAVWPLLDFGALDAEVDIADFEAQASLVELSQDHIKRRAASRYVARRLSRATRRMEQLSEAMLAAQRAVDSPTERYNRGLTDFLNVVDAERQFYDRGAIRRGPGWRREQFVQLYKSLGGGWQNYQAVPDIRRPQPAIVAAFRSVLSGNGP